MTEVMLWTGVGASRYAKDAIGELQMVDGLDLGEQLEAFVSDLVADGRYRDRTSVLRESLLLLQDRERKLRTFDEAINRGLADIEAGRVVSAEEIRAELRARYGTPSDVHE